MEFQKAADTINDGNRRPLKRHKGKENHQDENAIVVEEPQRGFLDDMPQDILTYITLKFLEDYPLRPAVQNPLGYLHVLSKTWNSILSGKFFIAELRKTPNAALHLLKISFFLPPNNEDLLRVAAPILDKSERQTAIVTAVDCDTLRMLASLPSYELMVTIHYTPNEVTLYRQMEEFYPTLEVEKWACYSQDEPLEVSDTMFILTVPQHLIVRLLFLEDLHHPLGFTWIFMAVAKSICHIYFRDQQHLPHLHKWIRNISGILLPFSKLDLTCEIMIWPMTLACLLEDWDFLELLAIDFSSLQQPVKDIRAFELSKAIGNCLKIRTFDRFPDDFCHFEQICSYYASLGFMGFNADGLKEIFRDLLPNFRHESAFRRITNLIAD